MHILVTNDDGPPSPHSSPYVASLISELQKAGHVVSVCLPHTQRSWIGKAHMIGQTLKPLYYRPSKQLYGEESEGTTSTRPTAGALEEEWILVDGTPASCVQIGLHHFFQDRGPIDLVVSGPNYGRNTTAVFALSSGTLGGALEAAVCHRRAIALSYAFFTRNHDPVIIGGASRHSVRVIEALYKQWPTDGSVDLYSVNVPLVEGVEGHKTLWTGMLQNYWRNGSCFEEIDGSVVDEDEEEERIRRGEETGGAATGGKPENGEATAPKAHRHKHFKWNPRFSDVYRSVDEAPPGNDGWAVKEGFTSVTPLKANFWQTQTDLHQTELTLPELQVSEPATSSDLAIRTIQQDASLPTPEARGGLTSTGADNPLYVLIDYEDPYVQPLLLSAVSSLLPSSTWIPLTRDPAVASRDDGTGISLATLLPSPTSRVLQITQYEAIDFSHAASHPSTALINSYKIRKALIRKHYLSATVDIWAAKRPEAALGKHIKWGEAFEVDYAEFLDDALVDAFDLRASMEKNETKEAHEREWWILKPGMSDRGQGIRLFTTMEELQDIFDGWEADRPDSDDEGGEGEGEGEADGDYVTTSHLRHFVAQPYIHPPLLLPSDGRKFHIRTYVLCVGSLQVYVYTDMLALFAGEAYAPPWETSDLTAHLTNTCLQGGPESGDRPPVRRFRDLELPPGMGDDMISQIKDVTGDVFEAAAREMGYHFQPLVNAFEVYGVDFLVDEGGTAWLLEVNAFPDFKQTGGDLAAVVEGFWEGVVRKAVLPFFGLGAGDEGKKEEAEEEEQMVLVRSVDLGRR